LTVSVADWLAPLKLAVMLTGVAEATDAVVMENEAVVDPLLTATLPGTVAAALLLDSATDAALVGAALKVTVP
jgi:hypothetical protein